MPEVTLHLGDCIEVLPTLEKDSVDLVLTDPPYYKVKGEAWDRQWDTPTLFLEWLDKVLEQLYRVLRPNGSLYVFASPNMAARVEVLVRGRFNVLNHIVWDKSSEPTHALKYGDDRFRQYVQKSERIIFAENYGADGYAKGEAGWGAKCDELRGFVFEPLRAYLDGERERAGISFEQVRQIVGCADGSGLPSHWFTSSQWMLPTEANYMKLRDGFHALNHGGEYLARDYEDLRRDYEDLRRPFSVSAEVPFTDIWNFKTVPARPNKHPCEKPVDMLEHIIRTSSREGATVLDCFMGSGSTGIAARNLGRGFIGIEREQRYFDTAQGRIEAVQMPLPYHA